MKHASAFSLSYQFLGTIPVRREIIPRRPFVAGIRKSVNHHFKFYYYSSSPSECSHGWTLFLAHSLLVHQSVDSDTSRWRKVYAVNRRNERKKKSLLGFWECRFYSNQLKAFGKLMSPDEGEQQWKKRRRKMKKKKQVSSQKVLNHSTFKSSNALSLKKIIYSNALNEEISYSSHLDNRKLIRGWLIAHECNSSVARSWNT